MPSKYCKKNNQINKQTKNKIMNFTIFCYTPLFVKDISICFPVHYSQMLKSTYRDFNFLQEAYSYMVHTGGSTVIIIY